MVLRPKEIACHLTFYEFKKKQIFQIFEILNEYEDFNLVFVHYYRLGKDNPKKGSDVDLGVLHKALFKTGAPNKTKVSFTVKV